jgi:hypothetical protein
MRKTVLVVFVLVLLFSASSSFAATGLGIGVEFGLNVLGGLPNQALLTLKMNNLPFVLGIGFQLMENYFNMGMTLDWWLFQSHLVGIIDIYIGPGLYLVLPNYFEIGGRVPIGLQIWPIGKVLELFLEIAPSMAFVSDRAGITIPNLGLQAGFGFRFWF